MPPPGGGQAGAVIVMFRGKVWGELDLTLKNRFLESGFRAAAEFSSLTETEADIKQEMILTDKENIRSAGNPGKILYRLYF